MEGPSEESIWRDDRPWGFYAQQNGTELGDQEIESADSAAAHPSGNAEPQYPADVTDGYDRNLDTRASTTYTWN